MQGKETGKTRQQRIQMDYYRQRGGIAYWKVLLAVVGGGVGVAAFGYAMVDSNAANPGPVAAAHAAFEQDCAQCHKNLTPIGSDSVRNLGVLGVSEEASVTHTFTACTSCHNGTGDPIDSHYGANMNMDGQWIDKNCALCHADHKGRGHDLTAVSNQSCTQCHSELSSFCPSGSMVKDKAITSFTEQHADFASLKQDDPGTVTFDHAQHMLPGQPSKGKDAMTVGNLEEEYRAKYKTKMLELGLTANDTDLVQLDCTSCHEFGGAPGGSVAQSADSELGRHVKPISFDQHCSACHAMNPAGREEGTLSLPHAAPWKEIDVLLQAKAGAGQPARTQSNPTGIGVTDASTQEGDAFTQAWKAGNLDIAKQMVKNQCLKCHEAGLIESDEMIMAQRNVDAAPLIPNRFLKHGIYDHGAHAKIDCKYCHADAYAEGTPAQPGNDQNVVMISGIESCTGCHRPSDQPTPASLMVGTGPNPLLGHQGLWASDSCTMCHRYHTSGAPSMSDVGAQAEASAPEGAGSSVEGATE